MKKLAFSILLFLIYTLSIKGQWNGSNPIWTNNIVGIGTTSPSGRIDIQSPITTQNVPDVTQKWSTTNNDYNLRLETLWNSGGINQNFIQKFAGTDYNVLSFYWGNVGIGTPLPSGKLGIGNQEDIISTTGITLGSNHSSIEFVGSNWANGYGNKIYAIDPQDGTGTDLRISTRNASTTWKDAITLKGNGNVGIGLINPFTTLMLSRITNGVNVARIGFYGQTGDGNNIDNGGVRFINDNSPFYSEIAGFRGGDSELAGLHFYTTNRDPEPRVRMTIIPEGNVGIGTTSPTYKLEINGNAGMNGDFFIKNTPVLSSDGQNTYLKSNAYTYFENSGTSLMVLTNEGKLGLGILTPGEYRLNVAGRIRANEVVVNMVGADFVFEEGYSLPGLSFIEEYIKENKHLPDIKSAAEMQKDGMNVSEMQTKLLQKIEELTLYSIEQNKRIEELNNEIKQLKEIINELH